MHETTKTARVGTGISLIDDHINDAVNSAVSSSTQYLGVEYVYRAHLMGYCKGRADGVKLIGCTYTYNVVGGLKDHLGSSGDGNVGIPIVVGPPPTLGVLCRAILAMYVMGTLSTLLSILVGSLALFQEK